MFWYLRLFPLNNKFRRAQFVKNPIILSPIYKMFGKMEYPRCILFSLGLTIIVHSVYSKVSEDMDFVFDDDTPSQFRGKRADQEEGPRTYQPTGVNQDRALGKKKKAKANATNNQKPMYPWNSTAAKEHITLVYTKEMKNHERADEEPFRDAYYDDYDFEFPKGMVRNQNFEEKVKTYREVRSNGTGNAPPAEESGAENKDQPE